MRKEKVMNYHERLAKKLKALLITGRISDTYFLKQINLVQFMALDGIEEPLYVVDYWEARYE